jgi:uncharacterized sporulation protein YeaH/YhbH (DUF444 family)
MLPKDPLLSQIAALLAEADGHDDPAQIERTLTDGYARALALEAEHRRLSQRIRKMTVAAELAAAVQLLERQEDEIGALRRELGRLQHRHSSAVRALAG